MSDKKLVSKVAKDVLKSGLTAGSHHAKIRSAISKILGEKPTKEFYSDVVTAMNAPSAMKTRKVVKKSGRKPPRAKAKKERSKPKAKVLRITETNESGNPLRVVIKCHDPQRDKNKKSVCVTEREIKIQDAFQVYRCVPCQARYVQISRNKMARKRREMRANRRGKTAV